MGVEVRETGHATAEDRTNAAQRIYSEIIFCSEWREKVSALNEKFLDSLGDQMFNGYEVSAKQWFWLKDIYDKLVERGLI